MVTSFAYESDCKPERFPLVKGGNWLKTVGIKKNIIFNTTQIERYNFINVGIKPASNVKQLTIRQ
ncbi:hypothetical protein [Levilactobacillus wangkuiensis]|uniref:hypothetical protein n=1 Tax=Levilactobacillus wangkuiensis TaxID=2799566 RepID=UPI001950D98F|nr:hypothetical protein [Levilactobacillus wangkuiensis]